MASQNEIYGIKFSSPPKNHEVLKLLTKFLKESQGVEGFNAHSVKHNQIIETGLLSWNLIDSNSFRQMYAQERDQVENRLLEFQQVTTEGWGLKQWFGLFNILVIICSVAFIGYKYFSGKEERELEKQARKAFYAEVFRSQSLVEANLKDPDSAEFKDQIYNCGLVNAKNGFGAYMGYKRYVVVVNQVFLEGSNADSDSMTKLWNEACRK